MTDGYWYHGNGKIGGEFHPTKPNDEEHYGEYVKVKHGHWIKHNHYVECSLCHRRWNSDYNDVYAFNYCPKCGARMDEVEE